MIVTKILGSYFPVKALHLHPRYYTFLIESADKLFYYDCVSSLQIWEYQYEGDILIAFSLDFNQVYVLAGNQIASVSNGVAKQLCETSIRIPDYFVINDLYYIFIKDDEVIFQHRVTQDVTTIKLPKKYKQILFLRSNQIETLSCLAVIDTQIQLLQVNFPQRKLLVRSNLDVDPGTIRQVKIDEINKKIYLLIDHTITIVSFKDDTLLLHSRPVHQGDLLDLTYFSFAQNTDSVGGRYKIQYVVILVGSGQRIDILEVESGLVKSTLRLQEPVSRIYFNKLFDNSFIALSPRGEVFRVNIFGYEKEWVCLGFKFVHVENNQIYEQKEEDFEGNNGVKGKGLTECELDNYNLSIFSAEEMLEGRVKRLKFQL